MEKDLSPQESLSIISTMIEKAKCKISDSSHYFLLWGYAVFFACLTQFVMMSVGFERHYMAWWIMLPTMVIHFVLISRDHKRRDKVSTYVSEANGYLWMGIGICFGVIPFIFSEIGWQYSFPFYVLFYALGTFVSGSLIRFKPMIIGGICCFVIAAAIAYFKYEIQILLTAVSILISYIIPGHLLRSQYKTKTTES